MVPLGDRATRFELPPDVDRRALVTALRALAGAVDVTLAEELGAVEHDGSVDAASFESAIARAIEEAPRGAIGVGARHAVKAAYDGEDLDAIAAATRLPRDEVVRLHAAAEYTVTMLGFLPGFAYLRGLPAPLAAIPRRASPRPRVPARSLAMAAGYTGIYPRPSPGGWHLLGTAHQVPAFDIGDRVSFEPAGPAPPLVAPSRPDAPDPALEVVRVVGPAFVVDRTLTGERRRAIEVYGSITVRVAGHETTVSVDASSRAALLAVDVEALQGPLKRGDRLALSGEFSKRFGAPFAPSVPRSPAGPTARLSVGPDHVPPALLDTLLTTAFRISPSSDRAGTRLDADALPPPSRAVANAPRRSAPMVMGAIEATPSGFIVMGPDHPRTGGYPVIAVIRHASLAGFFARPVGSTVRFAV